MSFKLERIDERNPCSSYSVVLKPGLHCFGRNTFFDCDDMRVSRNQGQFDVGESITVKALHHNPCFYIKSCGEKKVLPQNSSVELTVGDKFGLLPDTYWYRITESDTIEENLDSNLNNIAHDISKDSKMDSKEVNPNDNRVGLTQINSDEEKEKTPKHGCDIIDDMLENNSPSILDNQSEITQNFTSGIPTVDNTETSPKRRLSNEDILNNPKKIKTEPNIDLETNDNSCKMSPTKDIKTELPSNSVKPKTEIEDASSPTAGTSSKETDPSLDKNQNATPPSPSKPGNPQPGRERCIYGASCYRRNPQHKIEFSHPNDSDWGTGARGQCPWGSRCRRRDPRHWAAHEHPPGTQPPSAQAPARGKMPRRKVKRDTSDNEEVSPNVSRLPAKRSRKTVKRTSWSGSESENEYDMDDPFLTDGSDDWQPSSGDESADWTQSQDF